MGASAAVSFPSAGTGAPGPDPAQDARNLSAFVGLLFFRCVWGSASASVELKFVFLVVKC